MSVSHQNMFAVPLVVYKHVYEVSSLYDIRKLHFQNPCFSRDSCEIYNRRRFGDALGCKLREEWSPKLPKLQDTDLSDPTNSRKAFELCTRLGLKFHGTFYDVINDVTSDVIFHLKKLILKPFLHIKGGKYEGSCFDIHKRTSSGLSKNRSRFPIRPS